MPPRSRRRGHADREHGGERTQHEHLTSVRREGGDEREQRRQQSDIVINQWRLARFDTKPANSTATLARESLREPRSR
ncbi:hypothetical protein [Burkholderia ambifaria]|uniref:hypothetical protein n=1 Tax=Burkholderia ambifaria TaxID=152480 RepID=UPI00158E438A|nr:hypothetical protein [Burkholderia ambifaria]MBR8348160.1 hypothetical protein [Burkholderia ambifaria]